MGILLAVFNARWGKLRLELGGPRRGYIYGYACRNGKKIRGFSGLTTGARRAVRRAGLAARMRFMTIVIDSVLFAVERCGG